MFPRLPLFRGSAPQEDVALDTTSVAEPQAASSLASISGAAVQPTRLSWACVPLTSPFHDSAGRCKRPEEIEAPCFASTWLFVLPLLPTSGGLSTPTARENHDSGWAGKQSLCYSIPPSASARRPEGRTRWAVCLDLPAGLRASRQRAKKENRPRSRVGPTSRGRLSPSRLRQTCTWPLLRGS